MRILTYLGFTLLSILIQFSVVDFIQSIMQHNEQAKDTNGTSQKRQLADVFDDFNKPHALYYQTRLNKGAAKIYDNTTILGLLTTEETTTTVFEVLYDESTSATDYESSITTETADYNTTEFDNVTDLTFFESNKTSAIPSLKPKKDDNIYCKCNFLYRICDINCCCDADCSDAEIEMFEDCTRNTTISFPHNDVCYSHLVYFGHEGPISTLLNDWFCIVKVNLPEKNVNRKKIRPLKTNNFFAWKGFEMSKMPYEFTNKIYELGDPIWLIKNGSIYYIDSPFPKINNYCNGRKAIQFLKDNKFSCHVRIRDIEMIQIIKSSEEASVISATPLSMNNTYLNCSSLHCTNWTLVICENTICTNYNKSIHEPVCSETSCINIALKLEYIFNYHDSKITNATIKFHVQNVKVDLQFMTQEIEVKFVLANTSIDQVLTLSGNPGYVYNLPVITSKAEGNFTENFYNKTTTAYFTLPGSQERNCVAHNLTDNLLLFGINKRCKCRYFHKYLELQNGTEQCKTIQSNINRYFDFKQTVISPLGDPQSLKDQEWIPMEQNITNKLLYGELDEKSSKLFCYNIITRYSYLFSFVEIEGNNRIIGIKFDTTVTNASFVLDDIYVKVTIDINFIDAFKPSIIEYYASSPNLNYHLPKGIFLPFTPNESSLVTINVFAFIYCYVAVLASK